jgi:diadenosine tetraphosphate (Ap4A) HIT family hydrolase
VEGCVFCAIAAGGAPASFVHQDSIVMSFVDMRPVNRGHVLVVPRQHAALIVDLDRDVWLRMCDVARRLDMALRAIDDLRCEAVNLFVADGTAAGQEVAHAHLHVIPRFAGDGFGLRHAPGYGATLSAEAMDATAALIRSRLS